MSGAPVGLQVPVEAAFALLDRSERRRVERFLLDSGHRLEVDLAAAAAAGEAELAWRLHRYFALAVRHAADPSLPHLRLEVPLLDLRQSTAKSAPLDLSGPLEEMERMPQLQLLLRLLDAQPPTRLSGCRVTRTSSGLLRASTDVLAPVWPILLGGPPSPFEVFRRVAVTASHAAWRDRRVRRLVRVEVVSHQDWLDPAPFASPA